VAILNGLFVTRSVSEEKARKMPSSIRVDTGSSSLTIFDVVPLEAPDVSRWEIHSLYLCAMNFMLAEAPDVSRRETHPLKPAGRRRE
jgi:hypothetical protein